MSAVTLWLLACTAATAAAQDAPPSPWYLERGTQVRADPAADAVVETSQQLAALLRDGGVPGFYDGQFASLAGRGEVLAAIIRDPAMNHVLRVMAVMALQEVETGAPVAEVLNPIVLTGEDEYDIEYSNWLRRGFDDMSLVDPQRRADLSQHARFALAKDGQPERVLEKIRVMETYIQNDLAKLLDPSIRSESTRDIDVAWGRLVMFDIGYHYQQFDDFAHAAEWFHMLTDNLPGHRETSMAHYNLGCIAALRGRPDDALEHLQAAYEVGFTDVAWMEEDGDLAGLRDTPGFRGLAAAMRNQSPPANPPEAPAGGPDAGPAPSTPEPESGTGTVDPAAPGRPADPR